MTYENFSTTGNHLKQTRDIFISEWDTDTYGQEPEIEVIHETKSIALDGPKGADRILIYESNQRFPYVDAPQEFRDQIYSYTIDIRLIRDNWDEGEKRLTQMINGVDNIMMTKRKTWFGYDSELLIQSGIDLSNKENKIFRFLFQIQITRHAVPVVTNEAVV